MKILYYDCFCGISGDMNLGALIELGVPVDFLISELKKLNIDKEFSLKISKGEKCGITGTKVDVILNNETNCKNKITCEHAHHHAQEHSHSHAHHHEHHHDHNHEHHHRNFADIKNIIESSKLSESVKKISINIFNEVAIAEAKVHGKSVDEVHFHEVGAVDSIVDIVGAAICLDYLKVDKVMSSHVQVGGGFVKCAHGIMPVPAPATAEILKDVPTKSGLVDFETTTPTGAAILKASVTEYCNNTNMIVEKIGYGLGTRDLDVPNILRAYIITAPERPLIEKEKQLITETNIDDMSSEIYSYIEEELFNAGALDVYKTAIIMKKGRPAVKLSVLLKEENRDAIHDIIFKHTTSGGLREYEVDKYMLKRDFTYVDTEYGKVRVKNLYLKNELLKQKIEFEDCKKIARAESISINEVYKLVKDAMEDEQ